MHTSVNNSVHLTSPANRNGHNQKLLHPHESVTYKLMTRAELHVLPTHAYNHKNYYIEFSTICVSHTSLSQYSRSHLIECHSSCSEY